MLIAALVIFAIMVAGFVLAALSTGEQPYRPPVQKAPTQLDAYRDPALFVPLEGESGDFPRGTWVD